MKWFMPAAQPSKLQKARSWKYRSNNPRSQSLWQTCHSVFGLNSQQSVRDKQEHRQHLAREQGLLDKAVASENDHVTCGLAWQQHHHVSRYQPVGRHSPAFISSSAFLACRYRCKDKLKCTHTLGSIQPQASKWRQGGRERWGEGLGP